MKTLASYWRGIFILVAAMVVDASVRFATSFNMDILLPTEAVLFMSGSALLLVASQYDKRISFVIQRFDLWFALAFLLAGIRGTLWAAGFSVFAANLVILVFGIAVGSRLYFWFKQERQAKSSMANENDTINH